MPALSFSNPTLIANLLAQDQEAERALATAKSEAERGFWVAERASLAHGLWLAGWLTERAA